MEVTRIRALSGPNLWTRHTAIEAMVRCQTPEQLQLTSAFESRLRHLFPGVGPLRTGAGKGHTTMAHAIESSTLHLQIEAGCTVTFSRTTATQEHGLYQVVVQNSVEEVGKLAMQLAIQLCEAAANSGHFDIDSALQNLRQLNEEIRLGPSTASIVDAAINRGIPFRRLTVGSMVQFGWGHKQRRIQAAEIDSSSAIAESIAQDKELTKKLLNAAGVPVPTGRPVEDAEDAWRAAQEIGLPVVVKPRDGNQGKGVAVNLKTKEDVIGAFNNALQFRDDIMVERYLLGSDYRLLVVGDKLVAASRREPPLVVGDGKLTVRQLVDKVNADPRRSDGHATSLTKIRFDEVAINRLKEQGYTAESVPAKGARVILRNNANLSTGGTATDVTDDVHPDVAANAIMAAQMVGLDICGVDVVCESILRPLEEQSGGIVEVNAAPGLRMHLSPSFGKGRNVGEAVIQAMFPDGDDARIPVIAVTGTNGKTTTVRLTAHLLRTSGMRVGMTNTDGVYIQERQIDSGDCSGPRSARSVLMHPDVDAAVLETARGGMLREGLAFDRCSVAVVTNIGKGDHLGLNYISTVEDLAVLKRVIVQNVYKSGMGVLNAADPIVVAMAAYCPGQVTFFALDSHHPVIATHRAQGKRVVFVEEDQVVAMQGKMQVRIPLSAIPVTLGGTIGFQIENAMASIASAWAVGISWDSICAGLATFISDARAVPGRFNVFEYKGATVIVDYGHNPDAIKALVQAVGNMPAQRRSVVISGAGDRRDEDIREQSRLIGEAFDDVVLYQDACQRGREDGEVLALLRDGLKGAKRTQKIEEIRGEFTAIDLALSKLGKGDLCLILIDQVEESLGHIHKRVSTSGEELLV
ncbi:MAG: cyanophycin synthetase [Limnohabitans sp.]|nr:cyanophycin synthetase [Limnohabitans sp.]